MKPPTRPMLFRTQGWWLTLLNASVFCALLLAITGSLYLIEALTTNAALNQLLMQTVQRELAEKPLDALSSLQAQMDPPHHPFNPTPLQAFFVLADRQGQVHNGIEYQIPGIPDRDALREVLATGSSDTREVTAGGRHLRLYTVPVRARSGEPVGALQAYISLQGRDSELQRLLFVLLVSLVLGSLVAVVAGRFLALRAMLPIQRAFGQQEQFVADASHELRTPLALLQADVEILRRALGLGSTNAAPGSSRKEADSKDSPAALWQLHLADIEVIEEIYEELGHMRVLVSDLLTLAAADAGSQLVRTEKVFLAPLLTAVAERLRPQTAQAQVTLEVLLPEDPQALVVEGDPAALRRLLLILLTNAITYTPTGGWIWLQAREGARKQIELSVRDTGRGIAAADLPHLFTRFYRGEKARPRRQPLAEGAASAGTGLGLAIARSIVERHQGTITASSPGEGQGSAFTVLLKPLRAPVSITH